MMNTEGIPAGILIGYHGTPAERRALWLSMLMTKESHKLFKRSSIPEEKEIGEMDGRIFNNYLSKYIKNDIKTNASNH